MENTPRMLAKKEKTLLSITGVSPLTYKDEESLRLTFPQKSLQYARSFLYLLRTSHGQEGTMGYKYLSANLSAVIGIRDSGIYVTPIVDETQGIELQQLCQDILQKTKCRIYVKKFSQEVYPYMRHVKKHPLGKKELEDGAYPETLLELGRLFLNTTGEINQSAKKLRRQLRRFKKLGVHYETTDKITQSNLPKIRALLKKDAGKYASYMPLVNFLIDNENKRYKVMLFVLDDKIDGLYIIEKFSPTESGLYCGVTSKDKGGSTEWMDWYFFHKLYAEGIEKIYFGGAETEGVDYYIKKLLAISPPYSVETVEYDSQMNFAQKAKSVITARWKQLKPSTKNNHVKKTLRKTLYNFNVS